MVKGVRLRDLLCGTNLSYIDDELGCGSGRISTQFWVVFIGSLGLKILRGHPKIKKSWVNLQLFNFPHRQNSYSIY